MKKPNIPKPDVDITIRTKNTNAIFTACLNAIEYKQVFSIKGASGTGKTTGFYQFNKLNEKKEKKQSIVYIDCAKAGATPKGIVCALLDAFEVSKKGTIAKQIEHWEDELDKHTPDLLILDEVSAIKGNSVVFLKTILTATKTKCGVVLAGTPYFFDNLDYGASKDKHLFDETRERIFLHSLTLVPATETDAKLILEVNHCPENIKEYILDENVNVKNDKTGKMEMQPNKAYWKLKGKKAGSFRGIWEAKIACEMVLKEKNRDLGTIGDTI